MSITKNNVSVKTGKSSFVYRTIAALIAIACVAAFFLPYTIFASSPNGLVTTELKLYELFEHISDAPYKFLSVIPLFTNPKSVLGLAGGLITYVLMLALVVAFIFAVITLIFGKKVKRLVSLSIIVYTWGAALYMIAVTSITCYLPIKIAFDTNSIILALIGTFVYFILMYATLDKKLYILNSVRFFLVLAFTVCLFLAITFDYDLIRKLLAEANFYKIVMVIAIGLTLVNAMIASVRASAQKAFAFDFISAVVQLVVAVALIVLSVISPVAAVVLLILSSIAAAISLILLILAFVNVKSAKRNAKAEIISDVAESGVSEETPVPACEPKAEVETATEEDFFAGKQIDTFIATLSVSERNQFAALYLLKHEDVMPEIPAYQIGGDNKHFFEIVFITLGEYRDKIPDELLSKMYNQMCVDYPQTDFPEV
ncbi:MAG: hypothetical protein IJX31_04260 [Clostridia bacterium]|nr:hypothetical protein [Clostridia bacterium]